MKTLLLNNYNYLRGGAETVLFSEAEVLEKNGNRVTVFSRKHPSNLPAQYESFFPPEMSTESLTPSAEGLRSLFEVFYSLKSRNCLHELLGKVKVDVAHVHNIYGRLTTSVLDVLSQKGIPVVMTLHDYKVICPNYKLMHHGKICEDCRGNGFYHAILNRCHKNSIVASTIYAVETYYNFIFRKYRKNVYRFIAPSQFLMRKLVEFGWPEHCISCIPNFLSVADIVPRFAPGGYFLYLGRLSSEKGIETLMKAFSQLKAPDAKLIIVGTGPLEGMLKEQGAAVPRISFTGYLSGEPLAEITRNALAVVVPSEWYENAPLSILEAMAYGKPVIGARIGGIPEMIEDGQTGFLYRSADVHDLANTLDIVSGLDPNIISAMGKRARRKVENEYNADVHYERLMALYHEAQTAMKRLAI